MWKKKLQKVDDYEIIECIGEGLTSCVYKAIKKNKCLGIEQTVALKILKSHQPVQTLAQEVVSLSQVDSPHCVKLYGWTSQERSLVLILEHLQGITLQELMASCILPVSLIEEIIAQIQDGLRDLRRYHLWHGDLGPKNIFVTQQGVIKLLDFGFSAQKELQACTFAYLAPEGWQKRNLSWESDLFSLGLLKIEMETLESVSSRQQAQERAFKMASQNSLLSLDPQARSFLDLQATSARREQLAFLVQKVQKKKQTHFLQSTLFCGEFQKGGVLFKGVRHLRTAVWSLGLAILFFSQSLHPATSKPIPQRQQRWRLEVRSQQWARIELLRLKNKKPYWVDEQYTPFRRQELPTGVYQIRWYSRHRSGLILVQLNKNRRILIP